ncbi:uncharacterized protein LOC141533485 [Cotesia typhae]|uniref:uncharacterized protein LOC141533485 n=1 Tax=Cotesia typhae TaxID=2053667 RepID=UPI003D693367
MQKLDDNKKLFSSAQKSDKRYGFIDISILNEIASQVNMDIDVDDLNQPTASSSNVLSGAALSRNQSITATDTTCSQQSEIVSEYEIPPNYQAAPPETDVITLELASALDRANVSNRNASFILSAAYKSVELDIKTLNLSCSTICRYWIRYRQTISENLKNYFKFEDRYTVHWDGKILSDITGSDSVDRIAIILSTSKTNQLLGVTKILDGSAESHSVAIIDTLKEWEVSPHIKAMCFDTPAVNTVYTFGSGFDELNLAPESTESLDLTRSHAPFFMVPDVNKINHGCNVSI